MNSGLKVKVLEHEAGLMIKEIIYGRLNLSRGLLRRMKNGGGVYLNGEPAYITVRVKSGDQLEIQFADAATSIEPEPIGLDILYQDQSMLVINKPPGMAVYPTRTYPEHTLVNGVAYLWQQQGLDRKVRLLHRLDRNTSGTIIIAKDPYTYHGLATQLKDGNLKRTYLAIVRGVPVPQRGFVEQPISRADDEQGHALRRVVDQGGKPAKTYYQVIQEYSGLSLLELELVTGRTHQIRVHMEWIGHPIIGDEMYYEESPLITRQALHAWSLTFTHPRTGRLMHVRSPLPVDMRNVLGRR